MRAWLKIFDHIQKSHNISYTLTILVTINIKQTLMQNEVQSHSKIIVKSGKNHNWITVKINRSAEMWPL